MSLSIHAKYRQLGLIFIIILLLAACSGTDGISLNKAEPTVTPIPEEPIEIARPTYTVERGTITRYLEFFGRLGPVQEVPAAFGSSGRVGEIFFEEGEFVEEGDLIAALDYLGDLQREQRLNEIALRRAEISVERAQLWLDEINAQYWAEPTTVKSREWDLELAQLNFEELEIRIGEQLETVDAAMLVAPISGLLVDSKIKVGQSVTEFINIVTIADVSETAILVDSYSLNIDDLSENMTVTMELSNQPGDLLTGYIRQMPYPFGSGPGRDADKNIYIQLDNPSVIDSFEIGDKFDIETIVAKSEDTLWLPPVAIREFGGRIFVMVEEDGVQRSVDIKLGIKTSDKVEIIEGLEEGQIVVGQ